MKARQNICHHGGVSVANMRLVVDVIDRRRDEILVHIIFVVQQ